MIRGVVLYLASVGVAQPSHNDNDDLSTRRHTWWRQKESNHSGVIWTETREPYYCATSGKCRKPSYGGWRFQAANLIAKERGRDAELTDIYQFGVYVGGSLNVIRTAWKLNDLPVGGVWGFDSFVGLQSGAKTDGDHSDWADGAFSAADALGVESMAALKRKILLVITEQDTSSLARSDWFGQKVGFVAGFYNESLHPGLARKRKMRPALYVDIDVDQYLPSLQALDWLLSEGLVRPGTYVGYDDIGSTDKWTAGESRAHLEVARKHSVRFRLVYNGCRRVSASNSLRQRGDEVQCPQLKGCRLYYKMIFRVEALGAGTTASAC
jgi:hypothetical protein